MSVRRNRRYALVLGLLAGLLVGGADVCRAVDVVEDSIPTEAAAPQRTGRANPYYDEVAPAEPARPNRSQRITPLRKKEASPPSTEPDRSAAPEPAPLEIVGKLDTTSLTKTPLPGVVDSAVVDSAAADGDDAEVVSSRTGRSGFGSSLIWAIGILAFGWIVRQFLRASGQLSVGTSSVLDVLSRQSIGPQQQLALIRFGPRVLLIGTTPTGMSTLATVEDPAEVQAIVTELRPAAVKGGATWLDLFRPRPTELPREDAPVNVTLATDRRATRVHHETLNGPDEDLAQGFVNRSYRDDSTSPVQNREVADV